MLADDEVVYAAKFHLFNGEVASLRCAPSMDFGMIKEELWKKKRLTNRQNDYEFRLANGEVFFEDKHHFARCLEVTELFNEHADKKQLVTLMLIPKRVVKGVDDEKTKNKKDKGVLDRGGIIMKTGVLFKLGRGKTGAWQKRFFAVQDMALYYFESEDDYKEAMATTRESRSTPIPLGSVRAVRYDHQADGEEKGEKKKKNKFRVIKDSKKFTFELKAEGLGFRDMVLCAKSEQEMNEWIMLFERLAMRRTKAMIFTCAEALRYNEQLREDGLFRVCGEMREILRLKKEFDCGIFNPIITDGDFAHNLSGLIKQCLKSMASPLLTFDLYEDWLSVVDDQPNIEMAKAVVAKLPASHSALCKYVFKFFYDVSCESEHNKMGIEQLFLVLAPTILSPLVNTLDSLHNDLRKEHLVTGVLIASQHILWPKDDEAGDTHFKLSAASRRKTLPAVPRSKSMFAANKGAALVAESQFVTQYREEINSTFEDFSPVYNDASLTVAHAWQELLEEVALLPGEQLEESDQRVVNGLFGAEDDWRKAVLAAMRSQADAVITARNELMWKRQQREEEERVRLDRMRELAEKARKEEEERRSAQISTEKWVTVKYAYAPPPNDVNDLPLTKDEQILVLDDADTTGWWKGRKVDGREGYFPYNYVA